MSVGVALPAFLFEKGRLAPLVLFAIVGVGILLPLGLVVVYITRQAEYSVNRVLQMTSAGFFLQTEQKNSLSTNKVVDILLTAQEFARLPIRRTDDEAMQRLAGELRNEVDSKDPKFTKMHPSVRKALLLITAQTSRQSGSVPPEMREDFETVVSLAPRLLEELLKLSQRGRAPVGYAWFRPFISILEYSQCLTQAVPVSALRSDKAGTSLEGLQSLLQLPHMDASLAKKLARCKVRCLADLLLLEAALREEAVASLSLSTPQRADFDAFLGAVPCISLRASCATQGEDGDVLEGDLATCSVGVRLERLTAKHPPRTPFFSGDKEEGWWVLLADVASNTMFASQRVSLHTKVGVTDAAAAAAASANSTLSNTQPAVGEQAVLLRFKAPPAGVHLLQVMVVSDYWIGCDRRVTLKLKVGKSARQERAASAAAGTGAEGKGGGSSDDEAEGVTVEAADADVTESGTSESEDGDARGNN